MSENSGIQPELTDWIYTARERFTPADTERWRDYVHWIGFTHIKELVTLDNIMCPDLVDELQDEDWSHNVQADYRITWFRELNYLKQRCVWRREHDQIIAMIESPRDQHEPPDGFVHVGFDILDGYDSNSVLTNCGRFPGIIDPQSVNCWGLLPDLETAKSIAERIRTAFPDEPHCMDCREWQIARDADVGT